MSGYSWRSSSNCLLSCLLDIVICIEQTLICYRNGIVADSLIVWMRSYKYLLNKAHWGNCKNCDVVSFGGDTAILPWAILEKVPANWSFVSWGLVQLGFI